MTRAELLALPEGTPVRVAREFMCFVSGVGPHVREFLKFLKDVGAPGKDARALAWGPRACDTEFMLGFSSESGAWPPAECQVPLTVEEADGTDVGLWDCLETLGRADAGVPADLSAWPLPCPACGEPFALFVSFSSAATRPHACAFARDLRS